MRHRGPAAACARSTTGTPQVRRASSSQIANTSRDRFPHCVKDTTSSSHEKARLYPYIPATMMRRPDRKLLGPSNGDLPDGVKEGSFESVVCGVVRLQGWHFFVNQNAEAGLSTSLMKYLAGISQSSECCDPTQTEFVTATSPLHHARLSQTPNTRHGLHWLRR